MKSWASDETRDMTRRRYVDSDSISDASW